MLALVAHLNTFFEFKLEEQSSQNPQNMGREKEVD